MKQIISNHFKLQHTRFRRASLEFGLSPLASYILVAVIFCIISGVFLSRSIIEQWEYLAIPIISMFFISNPGRLKFYKTIYNKDVFNRIRWIENLIIAVPFFLCLIVTKAFIPAFTLLLISMMASMSNRNLIPSLTIPTPYYKYPFEFTSGFRIIWIMLIMLYIIFSIAAYFDNSYLGIFILVITALCSTFYYQRQEAVFYIWIHKMNSNSFLFHKIKIALGYTLISCLLLLISAIIIWPYMALWIILLFISALLFISTFIMAKYAIYPYIFNLPITIALSIGFIAPPVLVFLFPYLLRRASQNLKNILS